MWVLGRLAGLLAVAAMMLAGSATPAAAHATLLFTSPAADGTVPTSPASLTLIFDQPVGLTGASIRLRGDDRQPVPLGPAALDHGGRGLTAAVGRSLPAGVYTVDWQVVARDGDVMGGAYRFAVGPAAAALSGGKTGSGTRGPGTVAVLRWLLFAGLAVYMGGLAGRYLARRHRTHAPADPPTPWLAPAALGGLAASLGLAALITGDGSLTRGLARLTPAHLLDSRPGLLAALTVAGFAVTALAVAARRPVWGLPALGVVVAAEALRAHPHTAAAGWGALLTVVHLLAACLWAGALVQVLRTMLAWRARPAVARALLGSYARAAVWLFLATVATGTVAALVLVPLGDLLTTGYGQVLLAKVVLVAAAAELALAARRTLRRGSAREAGGPGVGPRPAQVEAGVLVAVLGLTGLLTALPTPQDRQQDLPFPPPAAGPIVPAGTLAGQIGVAARASTGQLVVQLSTPDLDPGEASVSRQQYRLSAALAEPDDRARNLPLRGCGSGCFVAAHEWRDGTSRLTLTATAPGWAGSEASLAITWPPRPEPQTLRRAVAAMRAVPVFTLHELVTSDTTRGLGTPHALRLTGARFLASEPYGHGIAPVTTRLAGDGRQTRLALAYPAENVQIDLTLDARGRIARETLAAPQHLVTRTFVYAEPEP